MNYTVDDIDAIEEWWVIKSRVNFLAFRKYIHNKDFKCGWFTEDVCKQLQQFFIDLINNEKPILILESPPQHGKSLAVTDFIAWASGKQTQLKSIYSSYSNTLGIRCNTQLQRIYDSEKYKKIFPDLKINRDNVVTISDKLKRNSEHIEYGDDAGTNTGGYFRNTTVGGAITGESLDLGVIDDPVKGRAESNSKTVQERTWNWFTDDFYTRFSETAGLLLILTRWSKIDMAERLKKDDGTVKTITYKAIAEKDEEHRKEGEALFPALKSKEFLVKRKKKMSLENWSSLYQQSPIVRGGNIFKFDDWMWWKALPEIKFTFMVADTASKKNTWNDFTSLQLWGYGHDNNIYLLDMKHKRMESHELRTTAKLLYNKHNTGKLILPGNYKSPQKRVKLRKFYVEDKSSGIGLIQDFKRDRVKIEAVPRSVDKIERAYDAQPEIESGRVYLNDAVPHVSIITEEGADFPNGAYDDGIDCTMSAIEIAYFRGLNSKLMGVV
jgi:predicted phage terminase large subunit-like protein